MLQVTSIGFPPIKQPLALEAAALAFGCPRKWDRKRRHVHVLLVDYVESEGRFIGLEMKGHERGLLGAGRFLLKPVDRAGFRDQVQRFVP